MQKLTENATEGAITRMGSLLAASVPSVERVCKQAQTALNTAIIKARMLLEKPEGDARRRLEATVALIGERSGPTALATHVEGLLREELNTLLDMFVHDIEVLVENKESPAGSEELASVLALLIDDLRRRIELHAQPHIKKVAGSIAARVDPKLRCGPVHQPKERTGDTSTSGGPGTAAAVHPEPQDESFQAAAAGKSRAAKVEEEAAWDVYAGMLGALLSELEKALDDPAALVQAAVLRQGKSLLCRAGFERRLASLRHHTKELEARTRENLSSDDSKKLGSFGVALESNMRNALRNQALRSVSRFATLTLSGLAKNMLTMKPTELVKNIDELEFLRKQIEKLADADVTEAAWLDFFETWQATLALRSQVEAEAAQHIFDAILTDDEVLKGLGAAFQFRDAVIQSGRVPAFILSQLKHGPGKHIKANAYKYQQKLDRELARIRRIQTLQARLVALSGTAIASVLIGLSSLGSRIAYEYIYGTEAV